MAWTWQSLRGRLLTVQASPNVYRFKGTVIRSGGTKEERMGRIPGFGRGEISAAAVGGSFSTVRGMRRFLEKSVRSAVSKRTTFLARFPFQL
jgi:hypothetical protein